MLWGGEGGGGLGSPDLAPLRYAALRYNTIRFFRYFSLNTPRYNTIRYTTRYDELYHKNAMYSKVANRSERIC